MSGNNRKGGNSLEQTLALEYVRREIAKELGLDPDKFPDKEISVGDYYVKVRGFSRDPDVICEASARIGKMKSAQIDKVMNDALKMLYLDRHYGVQFRKILAFIDEDAASKFKENGWHGKCLKTFDIEVIVIDVPEAIKQDILEAQKRQADALKSY